MFPPDKEKQEYSLGSSITAAPGTPFEVQPTVSNRKKALPYKGKLSSSTVRVSFCEARIRINEFYEAGNLAPIQVADISLNGNVVSSGASTVNLVLPCKTYELSARYHTGSTELKAKQSLELNPDKPTTVNLTLHE